MPLSPKHCIKVSDALPPDVFAHHLRMILQGFFFPFFLVYGTVLRPFILSFFDKFQNRKSGFKTIWINSPHQTHHESAKLLISSLEQKKKNLMSFNKFIF